MATQYSEYLPKGENRLVFKEVDYWVRTCLPSPPTRLCAHAALSAHSCTASECGSELLPSAIACRSVEMGRHRSTLRELGWGVSNSPNPWKQGSAKRVVRTLDYSQAEVIDESASAAQSINPNPVDDKANQLQQDAGALKRPSTPAALAPSRRQRRPGTPCAPATR